MSSQFTNLIKIGKGTYGTVYSAYDTKMKRRVAIKRIMFNDVKEGIPCTTIREIAALRHLNHPNIVHVYEILRTQKHLQMVFEYCEWDLSKYLKESDRCIPYTQIKSFTKQILMAIDYMHSEGIIHRDIKPQNILVTSNKEVRICDFGLCRSSRIPVNSFSPDVITQWYRPPEILNGSKEYTKAVDIWSVGCVVVEMLTGLPLFPCDTKEEHLSEIDRLLDNKGKELVEEIGYCDKGMLELLLMMLDKNPNTRITAGDALKHRSLLI